MYSLNEFPLPYATDALAPYISARTMEFHHDRHLATYIKNLNDLITGTAYEQMPLREIIRASKSDAAAKKIFNNAAQVFNHDFFFHCMTPNGTATPPREITRTFGTIAEFKRQFRDAAAGLFGSGWTWLVRDSDGALRIMTTSNADTPIAHGHRPLLTLDVWEHAYYLDYQNRRPEFIDAFLDHLVDWEFVAGGL